MGGAAGDYRRTGVRDLMRAVIQRVTKASVTIDRKVNGAIDKGILILLGVGKEDTRADIEKLGNKLVKLRIFEDEEGRTNKSITDIGGKFLIVSQFTLYWSCKKGNRPSFDSAMEPGRAKELYEEFVEYMRGTGIPCETGVFGADMKVELLNDGPVTVWLDTKENL